MYPAQSISISTEIEQQLKTEYNKLKNEAHQKAREIIVRCAFIFEELGNPISGIAAKLTEDLPCSQRWIQEVLPEKYKRGYQKRTSSQFEPSTLEGPLLIAIHSVVKTAELLKEVCNNLPKKLMANKGKLAGLQQEVSSNIIKEFQETDAEIQKTLAGIAELEDEGLIINTLERTQLKMLAQTHSLRQIAKHYHELIQELHDPVSAKIISRIVKAGE